MPKARIKLHSTDIKKVDSVVNQIVDIARKTGTEVVGPIFLPTKRLEVPVRKGPDGEGTETWDRWEMRIHKRMVDIDANERALHLVMKVPIPQDVNIEIQVIE